jgi:chemotaxis protein histidine kinase CheA
LHDLETELDVYMKNKTIPSGAMFYERVHIVESLLAEYKNIASQIMTNLEKYYQSDRGTSQTDSDFLTDDVFDLVKEFDKMQTMSLNFEQKAVWKKIKEKMILKGTMSFSEICKEIFKGTIALSKDLQKEVPKFLISENEIYFKKEHAQLVNHICLHLVRNSLVHGIELPLERAKVQKVPRGVISIKFIQEGEWIILQYSDDGKGISIQQLKENLMKKFSFQTEDFKMIPVEELVLMIFKSGYSTSQNVSELAGRGVGLDAVRKFMESIHGKIELNIYPLDSHIHAKEEMKIEFRFYFPAKMTVNLSERRKILAA